MRFHYRKLNLMIAYKLNIHTLTQSKVGNYLFENEISLFSELIGMNPCPAKFKTMIVWNSQLPVESPHRS